MNRQADWRIADESRPKRPDITMGRKNHGNQYLGIHKMCIDCEFFDLFEKGGTINSEYYIALLEYLKSEFASKRPHYKKTDVLLSRQSFHMIIVTMAKLSEMDASVINIVS